MSFVTTEIPNGDLVAIRVPKSELSVHLGKESNVLG